MRKNKSTQKCQANLRLKKRKIEESSIKTQDNLKIENKLVEINIHINNVKH